MLKTHKIKLSLIISLKKTDQDISVALTGFFNERSLKIHFYFV